MYQVNIVKLTQDLASYIEKEAALTGVTKEQILSKIGITRTTFREIKKRENGPQLRMDVFLLIVSWMGVEPGRYFITSKP